ncbi:MAG: hypothetical protein L6416_12710, partial [Candidatus Omnitrophica bacterium]|nr:hypothetical protein [Candidatus Omnitrophota bacterium]
MYKIELNTAANTLEIHLREYFDTLQGGELFCELSRSIHELKPGFKLLTDLSELRNMDVDAHKSIDEIM